MAGRGVTQLKLLASLCLFIATADYTNGERVKQKIYQDIQGDMACFKRFNGTHEFGCTSKFYGNLGVVHVVDSSEDLTWVFDHGPHQPYVLALYPEFMTVEVLQQADHSGKVSGVILMVEEDFDPASLYSGFSGETPCPNEGLGLYTQSLNPEYAGEAWGYIGSSRMVWDMEKGQFPFEPQKNEPDQIFYQVNQFYYFSSVDNGTCFESTVRKTEAMSPAFLIDDYDWQSGEYSTWTESGWQLTELRIFLRPSVVHEIALTSRTWYSWDARPGNPFPINFDHFQDALNGVLSSQIKEQQDSCDKVIFCQNFEDALKAATSQSSEVETVWVIGGHSLYKMALQSEHLHRIYLTKIMKEFECDVFFPSFDINHFKLVEDPSVSSELQQEGDIQYKYEVYEKI
ncbi:hypothetical protein O3P69_015342 [Scylla paramamosain]|uniref:Nicastrin n=1 Tax=Scylla paramamosain TaxID=85552 RepID=A0AAW0T4M6_SCYPA